MQRCTCLHVHVYADSCAAEAGSLAELGEGSARCTCAAPTSLRHIHTHHANFGIWMQMPAIIIGSFFNFFGFNTRRHNHRTPGYFIERGEDAEAKRLQVQAEMTVRNFWNFRIPVDIVYFNSSFR